MSRSISNDWKSCPMFATRQSPSELERHHRYRPFGSTARHVIGLGVPCSHEFSHLNSGNGSWTKAWIRFHFSYGESRAVIMFSTWSMRNDGAAWNLLSGQSWLLITISLGVLLFLATCRADTYGLHKFYGLLLGGIAEI